jgi:hypothetical protein
MISRSSYRASRTCDICSERVPESDLLHTIGTQRKFHIELGTGHMLPLQQALSALYCSRSQFPFLHSQV